MKNTILNYKTQQIQMDLGLGQSTYQVYDYFSKDVNIHDIISQLEPLLAIYECNNGDKLERISYELYNTTNYWDVLLMLNQKSPLFDMPYDDGVINTISQNFIREYQVITYSHAPLIQAAADRLFEERVEQLLDRNEQLRNIIVVKPQQMNNFLSILRENGYL